MVHSVYRDTAQVPTTGAAVSESANVVARARVPSPPAKAFQNEPRLDRRSPGQHSLRAHQALLLVAVIGPFGPALVAWGSIIQLPAVGVMSTAACGLILLLACLIAVCSSERSLARLDVVVLVLAMTILGGWAATELYFYPAYGTDEAAFVQYPAHLALHGHNPYKTNLLPALTQFRVPIQYATYKLDGTIASSLSYPSLSFLLIVPFLSITNGVQTIILLNIVFLAAEMLILFVVMPRQYRSLAPLIVLGLPFLFDYTVGGDIVTFSVPFLLIVAYHWTETGRYGRLGPSGTAKAICLGLAASISQFAWFVAPFVAIGIGECGNQSWEIGRPPRLLPAMRDRDGHCPARERAVHHVVTNGVAPWRAFPVVPACDPLRSRSHRRSCVLPYRRR